MIFTSRVANVMVRPSILIDLVFSKTLIRKARLIPGLFFYIFTDRVARAGSQVTYLVANARSFRVQGPGSSKNKDCNMCIVCYNVFSKWKTATNPEMPGQSGSVMVDLNKNEAGDRYLH